MCVYWKYSAVFEHGHISLCCRKLWTPSVKIRYTSVGPAEGSLVIEDSKFLRVVGTNNRAGSTKSCCHKTTCMGNNPKPLTRSLRCTCIYIAARRLDYCTHEAVPSRRMGLHNSVKLCMCSLELNLCLFCDILGEWIWWTFLVKYVLKSQASYAGSLWKWRNACFCLSYDERHSIIEYLL